jgi:hypothetical protein
MKGVKKMVHTILIIIAIILWGLAGFGIAWKKISFVALGLMCFGISLLV